MDNLLLLITTTVAKNDLQIRTMGYLVTHGALCPAKPRYGYI